MKKVISTAAALTFVLGLALTSQAARTIDCEVVASKDKTVIIDCGKKAKKLEIGDSVKVRKEIEGC